MKVRLLVAAILILLCSGCVAPYYYGDPYYPYGYGYSYLYRPPVFYFNPYFYYPGPYYYYHGPRR